MLTLKIIYFTIFPLICYLIAKEKGRNTIVWAIAGFFFQFIAVIIIALLPDNEKEQLLEYEVRNLKDKLSKSELVNATQVDESKVFLCDSCRYLSPLKICTEFKTDIQINISECNHYHQKNQLQN